MPRARHVCVKVPAASDGERRSEYKRCADRETWVRHMLGPEGVYCGRPKNDGGWYQSATVKEGSMFANPYPLKEYSLDKSLAHFRRFVELRASAGVTMEELLALLPPTQRRLAGQRFAGGEEHANVGKSIAHLQLSVHGLPFREALCDLKGKKLGCFCGEDEPCHADILSELAEAMSNEAPCKAESTVHEQQNRKRKLPSTDLLTVRRS